MIALARKRFRKGLPWQLWLMGAVVMLLMVQWLKEHGLLVWTIRLAMVAAAIWIALKISDAALSVWARLQKLLGGAKPSVKAEDDGFYRSPEWRQMRSLFWRVADYATDGDPRCMYCGVHCDRQSREHSHVDHLQPRSRRPDLALDIRNLGPACETCNVSKGARTWKGFTVDPRIARAAEIVHENGNRWPRQWRRRRYSEEG